MITDRFDALTRDLFTDSSRRGVLRTFLGSVVAFAGVASVDVSAADARKKKRKKKCKGGKKKCGKKCVDLQNDAANCGSCGNRCEAGAVCVDGVCTCPAGQADCGDGCIDIQTDAANCGICGIACPVGICVHGACVCTTDDDCPAGCSFCDDRVQGGKACVAGIDGSAACASDDDCPVGSFCAAEFAPRCSIPCGICPIGETACDETCANLLTDGANCGACGNVCETGSCVHGACACVIADNCPAGCFCSPRKQGGSVCTSGVGEPNCDTDEECPFRSVCVQFVDFCSNPCLG
jgi:hypothetical protein